MRFAVAPVSFVFSCCSLTAVAVAQTAPLHGRAHVDAATASASPPSRRMAQLAVVPVTRYDVAENKGFTDLWLIPTAGGPARQLTSDPAPDIAAGFSPDGKWIAFLSKRGEDKQNQLYVIAADGGEARRVTNMPTGVDVPRWFPDSHRIAFVTSIWTGPRALGRPGRAHAGTAGIQDDGAGLGPRAHRLLGSPAR